MVKAVISTIERCLAALRTLVCESSAAAADDVARLMQHVPKPPDGSRKRALDHDDKAKRMRKLELSVRVSLLNGGGAIRRQTSLNDEIRGRSRCRGLERRVSKSSRHHHASDLPSLLAREQLEELLQEPQATKLQRALEGLALREG